MFYGLLYTLCSFAYSLSSVPALIFSSLVGSVFGLSVLSFGSLVGRIRLLSILVSFAFPLFCILHVWSLLVILCSFPCLSFCYFQLPCQFYGLGLSLITGKSVRQYRRFLLLGRSQKLPLFSKVTAVELTRATKDRFLCSLFS